MIGLVFVALVATTPEASALKVPTTEAETGTGAAIALPSATSGKVALMVVGFTKSSTENAQAWFNQLHKDYGSNPTAAVLRICIVESVPRLFRGIARSTLKGQASAAQHPSLVLAFQGEDDWKKAVSFDSKAEDDAYLLIVNESGGVVWSSHANQPPVTGAGKPSDAYEALRKRSVELLAAKP